MDSGYVRGELMKLDLLEFYQNVSALAENWFGNGKATELSERLADFVLGNNTFGTKENSYALAVKDGRLQYLLKMFFPSYMEMTSIYPWLNGKRILLPICELFMKITLKP